MNRGDSLDSRSPDDDDKSGAGDDAGGRKGANRACDFCHRMKMKCIGKENPPCNRCRQSGHACTFEGPRKNKSAKVDDRLRFLEDQLGSMHGALEEILRVQRMGTMGPSPTSDHISRMHQNGSAQAFSPFDPIQNARSTLSPLFNRSELMHRHSMPMGSNSQSRNNNMINPYAKFQRDHPSASASHPSDEAEAHIDDPLNQQGSSPWDNMCSLAEAARLQLGDPGQHEAKEHGTLINGAGGASGADIAVETQRKSLHKRKRSSNSPATLEEMAEIGERHRSLKTVDLIRHPPDVIDLGYCDEATARRMFDLFMDKALVYSPCFDPNFDTFESIRRRSSFCLTAIIMIGTKISDGGGPISDLQRRSREYAETIGMATLFTPVASLEHAQAMVAMAAWGDTSWRPGGHASRIAMDLGLFRCLPLLLQGGMGRGKSGEALKADWPLVEGARTWLALYKLELEMSFNLGRPVTIGGPESVKLARALLTHPLSVPSDARLVSSCELLSTRLPLHDPIAITPREAALLPDLDEKLKELEEIVANWYKYWDHYHEERGVSKQSFLRESLFTMKCGTELNVNARLLHGIRNKRDVENLPGNRKKWLITATKAAEGIVSMALRSGQYRSNFHFANLYTHLNVAFAARCLIRLTSFVPEVVDVRQVGRDMESIADLLSKVPGFQYANLLRTVILQARRQNVLPPRSRFPSPDPPKTFQTPDAIDSQVNFPLPPIKSTEPPFDFLAHSNSPLDSVNSGNFFDFGYAEQLFSDQQGPLDVSQQVLDPLTLNLDGTQPVDANYNMDNWFPFPPLDSESNGHQSTNAIDNTVPHIPLDGVSSDHLQAGGARPLGWLW